MSTNAKVLFLCTGNSCRSQMAEGLLRSLAADRYEVFSAGTNPQALNQGAVRAMAELGIDISEQKSQHVDEFLQAGITTVITVCDNAKENCPIFPGAAKTIHWSFDDPAHATGSDDDRMAVFRRVRDEISAALCDWLDRTN